MAPRVTARILLPPVADPGAPGSVRKGQVTARALTTDDPPVRDGTPQRAFPTEFEPCSEA